MNIQEELELNFNHQHCKTNLKLDLEKEGLTPYIEEYATSQDISIDLAWEIVLACVITKRTTLITVIAQLQHLEDDLVVLAELVVALAHTPIIDMDISNPDVIVIYSKLTIEGTQRYYALPMVAEPRTVTHNLESAYFTLKGTVFTKRTKHKYPMNLKHLNRQNKIPLKVNERAIRNVEPVFTEKEGESFIDRRDRFKQWERLNRESVQLYALFTERVIYLTNRFDARGRTYTNGYHFNIQGDDYRKASLELAEKEYIND